MTKDLETFVQAIHDKKTFYSLFSLKTLPFSLDDVMNYIIANRLEKLFIDEDVVKNMDGFYLLFDKKENVYRLIETERNITFSSEKFNNLKDAIREKIRNQTANILSKFANINPI